MTKAFVYWNLHRKLWSIRVNGKVVAHQETVTLRNCRFKVSLAGNARVRVERRKNVHAGVEGYLFEDTISILDNPRSVEYNPYMMTAFQDTDGNAVFTADMVILDNGRATAYTIGA